MYRFRRPALYVICDLLGSLSVDAELGEQLHPARQREEEVPPQEADGGGEEEGGGAAAAAAAAAADGGRDVIWR